MVRKFWLIVLACVTLVGLGLVTPAVAGATSGYGYDGLNPYSTGCITGSYIAESVYIGGPATSAQVYLHYSPNCRTVWASIVNAPPGSAGNAANPSVDVHRNSDNARESTTCGNGKSSCYTNMLYDGGVTSHGYGCYDTGNQIYCKYTANF